MKDYLRPFAVVVFVALVVFTICLYVIPVPLLTYQISFKNEVTGRLTEGSDEIPSQPPLIAGNSGSYNTLRSWGIVRGKSPGEIPRADPGAPEILSRYQSIYLGDTNEKIIYLTFDEGYENGYTAKILDVLYDNGVNAIFFITGPYLEKQDELIRRMLDEGHAVGNHSVNHKSLPMLDDAELEKEVTELERRFLEKFGGDMVFLRPPKGEYSERSLGLTTRLGYVNVFWSFAYDDWSVNNQRGWQYAYNKVINNLHNGAILLLHAVSSDNAEALDAIIKEAKNQGYVFGDVHELEKLARGDV